MYYSKFILQSLCIASMLSVISCGSPKEVIVSYPVLGSNEILNSLAQITDDQNFIARSIGGYSNNGIIFVLDDKSIEGGMNIYKKENPLAPALVQVTSGANNLNIYPAYCESTNRIAFSKGIVGASSWDLYMTPGTGSPALIPVTETSSNSELKPSFSKDGKYLAYQRTPGASGINNIKSEIWVKNLETGENMLLGDGFTPSISPVDNKIVYCKMGNKNDVRHIWVMDIDGSNAVQITNNEYEFAGFPSWSPDGKKIIFMNVIKNSKNDFDLFIANPDGSNLHQITNNDSEDMFPYWSNDGYIYFISDRGGKSGQNQIWRFKYSF